VLKVESDSADQHMSSIAVTFDSVELKKKAKLPLNLSIVSALASAPVGESGSKLVAPSEGPLPADHPLNGQAYNVIQDAPNLISDSTTVTRAYLTARLVGRRGNLPPPIPDQ